MPPEISKEELIGGSRAAIMLLDTKIGSLIVERDNIVAAIEAANADIRRLIEQKESLEKRIDELVRLREKMRKTLKEEFGIDHDQIAI